STHDINATFSRLALNSNYLATIRKSVEQIFGVRRKGTHTAGDATTVIISYACKLFKDGIAKRNTSPPSRDAYNAPDICERGQIILLEKLGSFNDVVPEPNDAADQNFIPGVGPGGTDDDIIDWRDEGQRLIDDSVVFHTFVWNRISPYLIWNGISMDSI